ncbi:Wadjet anti-phage system protein JetD domain-containing protein [Luteimonas sp. MJ204]|uniref:Wadjet anti-phage system protein JetD domain-containing protein n=1 Tax=Luteimonas sp. MJ145 TaxID=3129234 RepID=UPI0031B9F6F8
MSLARGTLERLLRKGERARLRGDATAASLPMKTAASAKDYLALGTLAEREAFHAGVAMAERAGAVSVERDRHRGDGERLLRITVADLAALAAHLGVPLLEARVAAAETLLQPWLAHFPILDAVLQAWRTDRTLRGHGPEAAAALADAARAAAALQDAPGGERILRRESVRLFGDSKRLERLTPWLELLVTGETAATGLAREEVWSALGLRREPQPLLLAGDGRVDLAGTVLPLVRPYLGVPVDSLRRLDTGAGWLLTIENLASFHDAASDPASAQGLLLYTGGMPSPAWRRAYRRIIDALPATTALYHWGDIDEGGFRIAAVLAEVVRDAGRVLQPWRMSMATLRQSLDDPARGRPTPSTLAAMQRWARRAGWDDVAADLARQPLQLEQERLEIVLPAADGAR